MAHDVFICHSSEDKTIANAACAKLESAGIRCWMAPRDPIAGIPYGRQLVDAITSARIVLLIFSGNANRSEHVLRELEVASDSGKIIVPFRIENVAPSGDLRYYITRVHWLDAMSPPMEARLNELVTLMQRLLDMPLAPAAAATLPAVPKRPSYPLIAGLAVIAVAVAIALGFYFMKRSAPSAVHAIAKATPQQKRTAAHAARPQTKVVATPAPPAPPTPQIVYVPQPQGTAVSKKRAMPRPGARATLAPTAAPTLAPVIATRVPKWLRYRSMTGHIIVVTHSSDADWRLGRGCCYRNVGRTNLDGTAGTSLISANGRVWMFVPDLDAGGPYAHEVCFSNAGPGRCDAGRILPIIDAN